MAFDPDDPFGSVFADIIGRPAWQVVRGYGSFLTLEFGEPQPRVREPYVSTSSSAKARAGAARRLITVRGDWHLWICCCNWEVRVGEKLAGTSTASDKKMESAAKALDGQKLTAVTVDRAAGASRFSFDLGGRLDTIPYAERTYENWTFYCPDGNVLSYRGDGAFSWGPGDRTPDEHDWETAGGGAAPG